MVSLSIVIPAYNEQARLPATLKSIVEYFSSKSIHYEVIVADDGSADDTCKVAAQYAQTAPVRVVRNPDNQNFGKGFAVRNGMLAASYEWVLFSDADLSTPIEEVDKLYQRARDAGAAISIGSRALDRSLIEIRQPWFRENSGRLFNFVMGMVTGLPFSDTQCGFKLYRRDAAQSVFSRQQLNGFTFDVEDLMIAKLLGIPTVEVPVRWRNAEGTKVTLWHGVKSFGDLALIRWNQLRGRYR